jgi:hypothetical protein
MLGTKLGLRLPCARIVLFAPALRRRRDDGLAVATFLQKLIMMKLETASRGVEVHESSGYSR